MKNLIIVARRRAAFGDVFSQNQLLALQFTDLAFVGTDNGRTVRLYDAVKKLADLLVHGGALQLERRAALFCFLGAAIPKIAEHGGRKLNQLTRWRKRTHKGFKRLFHLCPPHGLAVAGAAMLAAHVIGIATSMTRSPSGRHGMVTIATSDKAAHREIRVDVLARWRADFARQAILNEVEGFKGNQPVMLPLAQRQVPTRHFDVSRIEWLGQDLSNALMGYPTLLSLGK